MVLRQFEDCGVIKPEEVDMWLISGKLKLDILSKTMLLATIPDASAQVTVRMCLLQAA